MTIGKFNRITDVIRNGGVVIADQYNDGYCDTHEITDTTDIMDIFKYDTQGYSFYIKNESVNFYDQELIG